MMMGDHLWEPKGSHFSMPWKWNATIDFVNEYDRNLWGPKPLYTYFCFRFNYVYEQDKANNDGERRML